LKISELDDWSRVRQAQLKKFKIFRGLKKFGGLLKVLLRIEKGRREARGMRGERGREGGSRKREDQGRDEGGTREG
jgi:hypothetical protein